MISNFYQTLGKLCVYLIVLLKYQRFEKQTISVIYFQIRRGSSIKLSNNSEIDIAGLTFVFSINQKLNEAIQTRNLLAFAETRRDQNIIAHPTQIKKFVSVVLLKHCLLLQIKFLNHKINAFQIFCTTFHNPHFLKKRHIFTWFSIFHNRVAAESRKLLVEI